MTRFGLLAVLCAVLGAAAEARDNEYLTAAEALQRLALQEMQWQLRVSDDETRAALRAMDSEKEPVVTAALAVIALHHLSAAAPRLKRGVGHPLGGSRPIGDVLGAAFRTGRPPIAALRTVATMDHPPAAALAFIRDREESAWEIATNIIVIDEARALRAGRKAKPDIEGLDLQRRQRLLLESSAQPRDQAIDQLIGRLSAAKVAGREEYELLDVLATYGDAATPRVLQRLEGGLGSKEITRYGTVLLLRSFGPRIYLHRLTPDTAERLRKVLTRLEQTGDPVLVERAQGIREFMENPEP